MDFGLKHLAMKGLRGPLQRCKRPCMTLEAMLLRENGGMVSQCAVSCVLECVLMLGTWNKTGETWKLGQNTKSRPERYSLWASFIHLVCGVLERQKILYLTGLGRGSSIPSASSWLYAEMDESTIHPHTHL